MIGYLPKIKVAQLDSFRMNCNFGEVDLNKQESYHYYSWAPSLHGGLSRGAKEVHFQKLG